MSLNWLKLVSLACLFNHFHEAKCFVEAENFFTTWTIVYSSKTQFTQLRSQRLLAKFNRQKITRQIFLHEKIRAYRRPCLLCPTCLTPYNVQDVHISVSYTIYQGLPQSGSQARHWARTLLVRLEQVSHSTYYSGSWHAHVADSEGRFKLFCKERSSLTNKQNYCSWINKSKPPNKEEML